MPACTESFSYNARVLRQRPWVGPLLHLGRSWIRFDQRLAHTLPPQVCRRLRVGQAKFAPRAR
jgi:hypothetical protein